MPCYPIGWCDYLFVIQGIIILASVKRIGGSCEPLARIYLHSSPNPSFGKGGALAVEILFIDSLFLCLLASSVIKTMTAPAVWQSCLRVVSDVFAELLCNLWSCIIALLVCKHPKPNNSIPLLWSRQPHHPSCSAQTLRRVSSLVVVLRKRSL